MARNAWSEVLAQKRAVGVQQSSSYRLLAVFSVRAAVFAEIWLGLEIEAVYEVLFHRDEAVLKLLVVWHLLLLLVEGPLLLGLDGREIPVKALSSPY